MSKPSLPASVFADDPAPQRVALARERLLADAGVLRRGSKHHHELEFGIDENRLAVDAEQREPPLFARKQPELIAVTEIRRRLARRERVRLAVPVGRIKKLLIRHELPAAGGDVNG